MALQSLYGPDGLTQTPPSIAPLSIRGNESAREGLPFTDLLRGFVNETDKQQLIEACMASGTKGWRVRFL